MFKFLKYLYINLNNFIFRYFNLIIRNKNQFSLKIDEILGIFFLFFVRKNNCFNGKVLLCRNEFYDRNKILDSYERFHLFDTLKDEDVDVEEYFWDRKKRFGTYNISFIKRVISINPEFLILSSYRPNKNRRISNPSIHVLNLLKKNTKIKIIQVLWDTCGYCIVEFSKMNNPLFDLNIITDNPKLYFIDGKVKSMSKILSLYTPYSKNSIFRPGIKIYDFCFLGQVGSYRDYRNEYLNFLSDNCVFKFHISSFDRKNQISHNEYAEILSTSKISINFSLSVDSHQLKGRISESMLSGCLLLESKNDQIVEYFDDGVDFVSFSSKEDLLAKVKFYVINERERVRISNNGRNKVLNHFSGDKFWKKVFNNLKHEF